MGAYFHFFGLRRTVLDAARRLGLPVSAAVRLGCARRTTLALGSAVVAAVLLAAVWGFGRPVAPSSVARRETPPTASRATPPVAAAVEVTAPTGTLLAPPRDEPIATGNLTSADAYVVVVASFRTPQRATDLSSRFTARGLPAFTRAGEERGWRLVLIGPYASVEEASQVREQIGTTEFVDSHVKRVPATVGDAQGLPPSRETIPTSN